jgi:hypothetical protein
VVSRTKTEKGGGGNEIDNFEVSTSANSAKISKNNTLQNIHTSEFSNLVPDGKNPAKTDQD